MQKFELGHVDQRPRFLEAEARERKPRLMGIPRRGLSGVPSWEVRRHHRHRDASFADPQNGWLAAFNLPAFSGGQRSPTLGH
jgi:hypothetical protein